MRAGLVVATALAALVAVTGTASAWDGPTSWYERADAASPGGGGIFGTGGQRDHRITCLDCHVERVESNLQLDLRFQPALGNLGGNATFVPGTRYRVDAVMVGETLRPPCGQYLTHTNNFAAVFEDDAGQVVGSLESDSGQRADSCPADYTRPATGTTALYRDCQVVFAKGDEHLTAWTFYWTAPAGGTVRLHYGAVDGNCDMMSMGDAAVTGRKTMVPAAAVSATPAPGSSTGWRTAAAAALVLAAGLALSLGRRRHPR